MTVDRVIVKASYGLDLVDAVTGSALVGWSDVRVVDPVGAIARPYRSGPSRWVLEQLDAGDAAFEIDATHYLSRLFLAEAGGDGPPVPASNAAAPLERVILLPRTGYPFPPSLTRILGSVVYGPAELPAVGAEITITPKHSGSPSTVLVTRSTEDAQYTMWFSPVAGETPPLADKVDIAGALTVGATTYEGELIDVSLASFRLTSAPRLVLEAVP